jgi:hypothetical protein
MAYTITTRSDGETLTSSKYNADHQNHSDNQTCQATDDYSTNVSQMRVTTNPGIAGSESLATTLAGELERLRYTIASIKTSLGQAASKQWYESLSQFSLTNPTFTNVTVNAQDSGANGGRITLKGSGANPDVLLTNLSGIFSRVVSGQTVPLSGFKTGTYVGNGAATQSVSVGFTPGCCIVLGTPPGAAMSSAVGFGAGNDFRTLSANGSLADDIGGFTTWGIGSPVSAGVAVVVANGFTAAGRLNTLGISYRWIAFA